MFRNPRENASATTQVKPSIGRPPSPQGSRSARPPSSNKVSPALSKNAVNFFTPRTNMKQSTAASINKSLAKSSKASLKGNKSILNFFKKVDPTTIDGSADSLFLADGSQGVRGEDEANRLPTPEPFDDEENRFNEAEGSNKRRRLSIETKDVEVVVKEENPPKPAAQSKAKPRRKGPFLEDSDTEDEDLHVEVVKEEVTDTVTTLGDIFKTNISPPESDKEGRESTNSPYTASITRNDTNNNDDEELPEGLDAYGFDDPDDPDRLQWLEDQEWDNDPLSEAEDLEDPALQVAEDEGISPCCPICDGKLVGLDENEASRHVNACLDGNPIPLPSAPKPVVQEPKMMPPDAGKRFARAAIARPGQSNPFDLSDPQSGKSSAFSRLMSGHAEDAAWATAAAAENASRGKPAYQRTCPFYKIMPGFYICVDAFKYGAVEGCNAYFLSHFHSDHYGGLTSTWSHGPIYCSTITANLVKLQLRVEDKWVVPIDFESKFEIPGTQGVSVTMIPANHCPGSSLFLFEKTYGKGPNPRTQRVLHCGDFRACQKHVEHPLLMPDVCDAVTGKTKQQKIDVCYLDTTYLNPKYAFPHQEEVVNACAEMCASLNKQRVDSTDTWEQTLKERAGSGMTKFVNAGKSDANDDADEEKTRGRLLVICGTYSIGKERICLGIARALNCKIWAPAAKRRICAALEDPELMERMTDNPREAQIHMQMLMEIRAETLQEYLNSYKPYFSRIVGFRPTGWNYRPPKSRFVESPSVQTVLSGSNWQSNYKMSDLIPQRGSTREAACFGVPYSEHSSFRELTLFCCALRIERIIPTVNVGSAASRARMKFWCDRWLAERRKNGPLKFGDGEGEVKW